MSVECSTSKKLFGILRSLNQMTSTVLALSVRFSYENREYGLWCKYLSGAFQETCGLVLRRDIGRIMFHVAYLYNKSLIVTMCKLLNALSSFGQMSNLRITSSRHSSNAQRPGCILNISLDCCTILRIDSLGVLVAHDLYLRDDTNHQA